MLEGIPTNTGAEPRPIPTPDSRDLDPSLKAGVTGALSTGSVAPGLGPAAPDPMTGSSAHEENQERDSSRGRWNADQGKATGLEGSRVFDLPGTRADQVAIRLDRETGTAVFELRDRESGKVLRQIPPQEMQELSRKMPGLLDGLLIDDMV